MKKFFKLCLAVAALATMFGFASCSNDSSNDSTTTPAATKTVKTTTVKIGDTEYSYTETDGKVDTSDKIKVADDGSITVTVADGSKVTISKDGKTITYTDKDGKAYTGQTGGESITLKSEDGKEITATSKTETKSAPVTPVATPAATETASDAAATLTIPTRTELTGKIFIKSDSGKPKKTYTFAADSITGVYHKDGTTNTNVYFDEANAVLDSSYTIRKAGKVYVMFDASKPKQERVSGTGLFTTWKRSDKTDTVTLKADGTLIATHDGTPFTGTFKNENGILEFTVPGQRVWTNLYDGTNIIDIECKVE